LLRDALDKGQPIILSNLQHASMPGELQVFIEKYGFFSLIATPIRTKDAILAPSFPCRQRLACSAVTT
jgi:hypothetical protein